MYLKYPLISRTVSVLDPPEVLWYQTCRTQILAVCQIAILVDCNTCYTFGAGFLATYFGNSLPSNCSNCISNFNGQPPPYGMIASSVQFVSRSIAQFQYTSLRTKCIGILVSHRWFIATYATSPGPSGCPRFTPSADGNKLSCVCVQGLHAC